MSISQNTYAKVIQQITFQNFYFDRKYLCSIYIQQRVRNLQQNNQKYAGFP